MCGVPREHRRKLAGWRGFAFGAIGHFCCNAAKMHLNFNCDWWQLCATLLRGQKWTLRPYRSVLYIPGSRARALDKARTMPVDSIIFDLEDAVALEEKASARAVLVAHLLEGGGYGSRSQIIRINGLDTPWAAEDIAAIAEVRPEAVLLPKVDNAPDDCRAGRG